jgi:hypothetical protein
VRACLQHSILYSKLLYSKFTQWEVLLWIIRLGARRFKNLYADLRTYILYCPRAERFASPPPPPPPHGSRLRVRARRACVCACAPAPPRARLRARIVTNPHRRRWRHRPRHQGQSPLLATAKLRSSPPLPLPRLQALPSSTQDFIALPASAKLSFSPLPSSPVQEGILTLKSFDCHLICHLT